MSRRNILLFTMICAVSLVILIRSQAPADEESSVLVIPPASSFDRIDVERFGLDPIKLVKNENDWFIEPGSDPVSKRVSELLKSTFAKPISSDYGLELVGLNPRDFSVTEAATVITIKSNQQTLLRFRMGKVLGGKQTFIRPLGEDRVFRMNGNLRKLFDRQPIDWRERRVVGLQANDIRALAASGHGFKAWRISRSSPDHDWNMDRPKSILISQATANAMANVVGTVRADAFHDRVGFEVQITIEIETFSAEKLLLELGPVDQHGGRLARFNSDQVFRIPRHQSMFMSPTVDTLRNRRLFKFTPDEAIELVFSGPPRIHLRKQNDDSWSMIAPEQHARLSNLVMDSALSQISSLETVGFPPIPGADAMKPVYAELTIKLMDNREVTVSLGRRFNNTDARYAESTSRPGMLYVLGLNSIKAIQPTVNDITLQAR